MLDRERIKTYTGRLLRSRMRILHNHGFFGLLLMNIGYGLEENMETAATDGNQIKFSPDFMDELSDGEIDFVLMHEILHVALQHCSRGLNYDQHLFNIACDIVVNSTILKENNMVHSSITLKSFGESMHLTPDGREGYLFTAEEVYEMLLKKSRASNTDVNKKSIQSAMSKSRKSTDEGWDDHTLWGSVRDKDGSYSETWAKRVADAAAAVSVINASKGRGALPLCIDRMLRELHEGSVDWKTILNNFVQDDICDYSFSPPDRRFDESGFFLPDFNERDYAVADVLFMVDTSASMSDSDIRDAYSEIKGAIDQFNGKLRGWIGFFDAAVVEPVPFTSADEMLVIRPKGGGGTDFDVIFEYVANHMAENPPKSIVILTDGYAPFPKKNVAEDIPVLWIINNDEVEVPWGKVARIK